MIVKVVSIEPENVTHGATHLFRTVVEFGGGISLLALWVGGAGRGRRQRFIPITNRPTPFTEYLTGEQYNVKCIRLRKGKAGWLGEVVEDTTSPTGTLVLLNTRGGYRGYTGLPTLFGEVQMLEVGWCAQGAAGRMGRWPELMLLATGPARIEWHRAGRLYGAEADWIAWSPDGLSWHVHDKPTYNIAVDVGIVPLAVQELEPVPPQEQA